MVEAFSEDLVRRITKLSIWQLRYWTELGIVAPSIAGLDGGPRLYSFLDLMRLKVAAELRQLPKTRPTDIKQTIDTLEARGFKDPFVTLSIYATQDGRHPVYLDPSFGGPLSAHKNEVGQIVETFNLPLRDLKTNLQESISEILDRQTGRVAKVRNLRGSEQVIEGTRVPTAKIAALAAAGWDQRRILAAYPHLTPADVKAALESEDKRALRSA